MGIDIAALKARLQGLNSKGGKKSFDIWKPKLGEHTVRFMPYLHGEDPFVTLYFHYEVGGATNRSLLCPKANYSKDCIVCEFADKLKAWKGDDGEDKPELERKKDFELFKKIQAKARIFVPVLVRDLESEGTKFYAITPKQSDLLLDICTDKDRVEAVPGADLNPLNVLFSPDGAFDVIVKVSKKSDQYNETSFAPKIKVTKLAPSKEAIANLVKSVKNIKEVYPEVSSAEVERVFNEFINSGMPVADASGGTEKYSGSKKQDVDSNSAEKPPISGRSIDDAFGDLTNDVS